MLICGVLLIELIYGLTSIPLNWDYRRSKLIYFFPFNQTLEEAGACDAQSGTDDDANQRHSAPMRSRAFPPPSSFPSKMGKKKM